MNAPGIVHQFDTYAEYQQAIGQVLEAAGNELSVFDTDLSQSGLESSAACTQLERFLRQRRKLSLRMVLHDTGYLERECPRLLQLLNLYSHAFEVKQLPDDLRHLTECFMLTDDATGVSRFHKDWPRGKWFVACPGEAGILQNRFRQLWDSALDGFSVTRLGL